MPEVLANSFAYRIRHLALEVRDLERAVLFYRSIFGMQVIRRRSNPFRNDIAAYVGYGDEAEQPSIELYQFLHAMPDSEIERRSHMAIAVRGIEEIFDRAINSGAKSKVPPQNNRPNSLNKFAFILDLDGHEIELTENS